MSMAMRAAGLVLRRYTVVGSLAILVSLASAGSASALTAPPFWKCRASALWASLADNNRIEPVLANGNPNTGQAGNPDRVQCANEEAGADNLLTPLGIPQSSIAAKSAAAKTNIDPEFGLAIDQKVTSTARVENLSLGTGPTGPPLFIGAATSEATGACSGATATLTGTSMLTDIKLGGETITLDQLVDELGKALAPLAPLVEIHPNEQIKDGDSIIQRALHVKLLNAPNTPPVLDLIVAETKASTNGPVCDRDRQFPFRVCPAGSIFEVTTSLCVIREVRDAAGNIITERIVVGRAFEGPGGGTVIPVETARQKYKSPCLRGAGPQYAVIGTNRRDRITGTNKADRILGLGGNDSLDGGRGNDCIDGGTGSDRATGGIGTDRVYGMKGNDTLTGNLGNDRLFGSVGNDHLNGGPGADLDDAGAGNDTINAGYGRDRVFGRGGRDFINIATQGPPATANCGAGPDKIRLNKKERRRITGCEIKYILNDV
jgi:hemolysin type calcium-binding protein